MANPYGIPDDSPVLGPGSVYSAAQNAQGAANAQAQNQYLQQIAAIERQRQMTAAAAQRAGPKIPALGALTQVMLDASATPELKAMAEKLAAEHYGYMPAAAPVPGAVDPATGKPKVDTNKPQGGFIDDASKIVSGGVAGFAGLVSGGLGLAGNLTGNKMLQDAGAATSQFIEKEITDPLLTDQAKKDKNLFTQKFTDPNATVDSMLGAMMDDPAMVGSVLAGFLVPGGVVGKVASLAGNTANAAKLATALQKFKMGAVARNGVPLAVSGTLTGSETGNLGNKVYNTLLADGASPDEARTGAQRAVQSKEALLSAGIGAVPIAEKILGPIARKPGFMNRLWRAMGFGTAESLQEGSQESLQQRAENIGTGIDPNTGLATAFKGGALLGGPGGALAGLVAPTSKEDGTVIPPPPKVDATGKPVVSAGTPGASDALSAKYNNTPAFKQNVDAVVRKATKLAGDDSTKIQSFIVTEMMKTNRYGTDRAAIESFATQLVSGSAAPQAAPVTGASNITGAPLGSTGGAPAQATAEQTAAADALTAQTTGAAINTAPIVSAATAEVKATEKLQTTTTTAAEQPAKSAEAVTTVIVDQVFGTENGKKAGDLEKTVETEQKAVKSQINKVEQDQLQQTEATVRLRKTLKDNAFRTAKARGASDADAIIYARIMEENIVVPHVGDSVTIEASIQRQFERLDKDISPTLATMRAKGSNLPAFDIRRGGYAVSPDGDGIIEGKFTEVPPLPQLAQGDRNLLGLDLNSSVSSAVDQPGVALPRMPKAQLALPDLSSTRQQLQPYIPPTAGIPGTGNLSTAPDPVESFYVINPELAEAFLKALQENTPESKARADAIQALAEDYVPGGMESFGPNTDPFNQEMEEGGDAQLQGKKAPKARKPKSPK